MSLADLFGVGLMIGIFLLICTIVMLAEHVTFKSHQIHFNLDFKNFKVAGNLLTYSEMERFNKLMVTCIQSKMSYSLCFLIYIYEMSSLNFQRLVENTNLITNRLRNKIRQ